MAKRDIIVMGASAGGVEALSQLARGLSAQLPAALFVVLHLPADSESMLPRILSRAGPLPAVTATDGAPIKQRTITVAPPDHHLVLDNGAVRIVRGPRENRHRPAVDVLFRSAALNYGPRVIGIVLSGTLDDGAAGMVEIHRTGGKGIVQSPDDALFPGMPRSAIAVDSDYILPVAEIPALLARLVQETVNEQEALPGRQELAPEVRIAEFDMKELSSDTHPGTPSPFSCPDCGGVLWEIGDEGTFRYRCRVGHAFSPDSLLASQSERLEAALWAAVRGLEEKAAFSRRVAAHAQQRQHPHNAAHFAAQADAAEQHARVVRELLLNENTHTPEDA